MRAPGARQVSGEGPGEAVRPRVVWPLTPGWHGWVRVLVIAPRWAGDGTTLGR